MDHGLKFQCHLKIFPPVDRGVPLMGEVVFLAIKYIKTKAGGILRPGCADLHTLDNLTYQKLKRNKYSITDVFPSHAAVAQ